MLKDEGPSGIALARQVLAWWHEAQYLTTGENGEKNVFDSEPSFVQTARGVVAREEGRDPPQKQ